MLLDDPAPDLLLLSFAVERDHSREEDIHVACWLSFFAHHTMWPLVFTWSVSHKKSVSAAQAPAASPEDNGECTNLLVVFEQRLPKLEAD